MLPLKTGTTTNPEWVSVNRDVLARAYYYAHEAIHGNNAYGFVPWDEATQSFYYAYADAMIESIKRDGGRLIEDPAA